MTKWCAPSLARDNGNFHRLVGMKLEIDTFPVISGKALGEDDCGGRFWRVTDGSRKAAAMTLGRSETGPFVCEHMLVLGD